MESESTGLLKGRGAPPSEALPAREGPAVQRTAGKRPRALDALQTVLVVALGLAALAWGALHYYPFIADDALISLRYSQRLVEGHGLTWTDGERVEGYTNLLWVLLVALLHAFGLDPITAARGLGIASVIVALVAIDRIRLDRSARSLLAALFAGTAFALSGPVAVWSIGGLEEPLYCALLAAGFALLAPALGAASAQPRAVFVAGIPLALMCWTRPDAPLFVAVLAAVLVVHARFRRAGFLSALALCALPVAAVLLQLAFRVAYYDDFVPNTARIKGKVDAQSVLKGVEYLGRGLAALWPLLIPALVAIYAALRHRAHRTRVFALLAMAVLWSAYVAAIGGDIFPAHRHHLPNVLLFTMLGFYGLDHVLQRWRSAAARGGLAALLIVGLAGFALLQRRDEYNHLGVRERWEWDGEVIGRLFRDGFAPKRPLLAVTAAGALPYFAELPALDMLGLNDRHIARQPPDGSGHVGHDHGDGVYVFARKPDLITFGIPAGGKPRYQSGRQLRAIRGFRKGYRLVTFEGFDPRYARSETYVRLEGPLGIEQSASRIRFPGYLLEGRVTAQLGAAGKMVARLEPEAAGETTSLLLEPGVYRVALEPDSALLQLDVRVLDSNTLRAAVGRPATLIVSSRTQVALRVSALHTTAFVGAVSLERFEGAVPAEDKVVSREWTPLAPALDRAALGAARTLRPDELEFLVPRNAILELQVGGGNRRAGVRLTRAGAILQQWSGGVDSNALQRVRFDLAPFAGQRLRLEVFDESPDRSSHVVLAKVRLRTR